MRVLTVFIVFLGIMGGDTFAAEVPPGYELRSIQGFTVLVRENVFHQPADRWQRKPLDVLEQEFADLKRAVGPKVMAMLQQVPVWVNWDAIDRSAPGIVAVYYGGGGKELERVGQSPLKANCIEILTLRRLGELRPPGSKFQQVITLHEMAHAVHHRLLGMDAAEVKSAFAQAVERKLYDDVVDRFNHRGRAYARTNEAEYFAEISCAYLDSCHFYPFTFSDLKVYDPAGFALMESVWKRPEQFAGRKIVIETPTFAKAGMAVGSASSVSGELDAFRRLDAARTMLREGKKVEGRRNLETVVNSYPNSQAAADARRLLDGLQ